MELGMGGRIGGYAAISEANEVHELQLHVEKKFVRKDEFHDLSEEVHELTMEVRSNGLAIIENRTELRNILVQLGGINSNLKWIVRVILGAVLLAALGVVLI